MRVAVVLFFALAGFAMASPADSAEACGSDAACLSRNAVFDVLAKPEFQPSIAAASFVTVCTITSMKVAAAAKIAAADAEAETQVRQAVASALSSLTAEAAAPFVEASSNAVRLSRRMQVLGHAAALDAFLRSYPRIRSDFCLSAEQDVKAFLAPQTQP